MPGTPARPEARFVDRQAYPGSRMTADRPYRKGLPYETALAEAQDKAGTQFDPACARALASLPCDRIRPLLEARAPDHQELTLHG